MQETLDELKAAFEKIGFPCVVKPLMSSSGKGHCLVKPAQNMLKYRCNGSRRDVKKN